MSGDERHRISESDPQRAREILGRHLPGWRMAEPDSSEGPDAFRLGLQAVRLSSVVIATVGFGTWTRVEVDPGDRFVVCSLLAGRVDVDEGAAERLDPRTGLIASSGGPGWSGTWSPGARGVVVSVPAAVLEQELERLLGHPLGHRLSFEPGLREGRRGTERWRSMMDLLVEELEAPGGMASHPVARVHLEQTVLDALLLAQPHSHSALADQADGGRTRGPRESVRRAIALMQERPGESWTTTLLARELFVSARALQEGFQRDLGLTPTGYLRQVRLRRVREELQAADPERTTVQAVAWSLGLFHLGRLAKDYRDAFGELPSETLGRPPV